MELMSYKLWVQTCVPKAPTISRKGDPTARAISFVFGVLGEKGCP